MSAIAEADYERFMNDTAYARATLDRLYEQHAELFAQSWPEGYALYGFTDESKKQGELARR